MQSTLDGKVVVFPTRRCASKQIAAQHVPKRAAALPRRVLTDGWWLVPAPPRPKQRPHLVLVSGCGGGKS
jgi:hypothetical protein